jgi:K+-sensing histidine kinase KdpD
MNVKQSTIRIERCPWNQPWLWFACAAIIAVVDFFTGPFIQFPIFFTIPVMFMAWTNGKRWAVALALMLCIARFIFNFYWVVPYTLWYAAINAIIRMFVLVVLAIVTAYLGEQTRRFRVRIQTLEGILPTCAWCKDIRDQNGQWHKMEAYITNHSQAQFSHGVCPKCQNQFLKEIPPNARNA